MPSLDTIRTITIKGQTDGVDQATASLKQLALAQGNVAVVSETSSKATLSAQAALDRLKRQVDSNYVSQQGFAKGETTLQKAMSQGLITTEEYGKLHDQLADKYGKVTGAQKAFGLASQSVQLQLMSLSGGLGLTGGILSAFGPIGFAAAVGLGAVQSALSSLSDMAHSLAEKSKVLREFSEATGLSTTAVQALKSEASKFGIDTETLQGGLQKFTANFEALRTGSGQLLTDIRRINPALADQMAATNDAAKAFTLYGQAVQQADNIFQRNALLKAGLGKGSAIFGAFFEGAPDVKALEASFSAAGKGIDENLIKRMAQLEIEITKTKAAANTVFSGIFGESTLNEEKAFAKVLLDIALTLKDISNWKLPSWVNTAARIASTGSLDPLTQARTQLRQGLGAGAESSSVAQSMSDRFSDRPSIDQITKGQFIGPVYTPRTPEYDLSKQKELVTVLGAAATPAEQLNLKLAELAIKARDAGVSDAELARAQGVLKESFRVDNLSGTISALGSAATPTEQLALKTAQLRQQYDQGRISRDTLTRSIEAAAFASDKAVASAREQLGVVSMQELQSQHLKQVEDDVAKGYIRNAEEKATAEAIFQRSLKDTSDRLEVMKSSFPQLTQLGLDASNTLKQIDLTSVSALSGIETSLLDMTTGTKSASQGFQDMSASIIRAIEQMIIKMTIIAPLAKTLESTLGGGNGGGLLSLLGIGASGAVNANGSITGALGATSVGGAPLVGLHSGGIVGSEATFTRYVHPAHFNDAPRFHTGGIAGDEVPIIAKRGEGVFTQGQMAAMGGGGKANVTVNVVNNTGTQAKVGQSVDANGDITITLDKAVDAAVGKSLSAGTGMRVLSKQYGVNQFAGQ
jgi:hypothetical protein